MMAYLCFTAQDSRTGIDNHMILNNRMSLLAREYFIHTQCPQGHPLVKLNMITDDACLTDHQSGTMVYIQILTDLCSRMYINSCFRMHIFRQDAWNKRQSRLP